MNAAEFVAKWRGVTLTERSASQSHFNDLCALFGVQTPVDADPTGAWFTFEKGATKATGGKGWADVWRKGCFAWEYKGHHADLAAAYRQLQLYRDDLENPPLLIVCDLDRVEVRTNFTGTAPDLHAFDLATLAEPANLRVLRAVFTDPNALRPKRTPDDVTRDAAARFGALAAALAARGEDPRRAAHFLVQLLFCLFAEDVGLLPRGLFADLLGYAARFPEEFKAQAAALLGAMRDGGAVAFRRVERFDGGLFAAVEPLALTGAELAQLHAAAGLDWGSVEPAIFGTLFERSLDPASRAPLGAFYTGRSDIQRVVEPVLMAPLRRRWNEVRAEAGRLAAAVEAAATPTTRRTRQGALARHLGAFQEELAAVRVLDPSCGSGNFLYVALAALLDLEKEVVACGTAAGLPALLPRVGPRQLAGLEVNPYAHELAQAVVWIGYLQWLGTNGFPPGSRDPILEPLDTIRLQDALLDRSDPKHPKEAVWPAADVIVGNPPFLGGKRLRAELGDETVKDLFAVYAGRVPREADLVVYFFEKARAEIAEGRAERAGLLATQSIRMGASRRVLEDIKRTGDIFMAWADEPWILDGVAVRISIVGFDNGTENERTHDGRLVPAINADLSVSVDLTIAKRLKENLGIAFQGPVKVGPFETEPEVAMMFLCRPVNPNGRPNSDVVRPWVNALDVTRRPRGMHIIDFGNLDLEGAALYEAPFEHVRRHVKPLRDANRDRQRRTYWWRLGRSGADLRRAVTSLERFLVTPRVATHRLFAWVDAATLPDSRVFAFARDDDYFFGVLHSRAHEVWSLRMGSWHGVGNDPTYNTGSCFETFPLPWPPGHEPAADPRVAAIAGAAKELDGRRRAWLDPPGAEAAALKQRTLTNLYNQRPTWLAHLHAALDRAVWAAYGWDDPDPAAVAEDAVLARLLALNLARAGAR